MKKLSKLLDKRSQDVKCCALCGHGAISNESHKEVFWVCNKISEYTGEAHYVEGSDVCKLFVRTDDFEEGEVA